MSGIDTRCDELKSRLAAIENILLKERLTEADVRAKLIDPLFLHGLGWPEGAIRRERITDRGEFIDYAFGNPIVQFLVEAKRATKPFVLPKASVRKTHNLQKLMQADKGLEKAIDQVARYCQDQGYPYGVLSNGLQLCVFRAIRTDRPWRGGEALVFEDAKALVSRFAELWNILSYPRVLEGSLGQFFTFPDELPRHHKSVISALPNADETLIRNSLSRELIPLLKGVFEDLTDEDRLEELRHCYVYSTPLDTTARDFVITIKDLPPPYLRGQVTDVHPTISSGGAFHQKIRELETSGKRGLVMLLLGGVGAGKTTFLRQVRVRYCADEIERSGAFFYLDFRDAPLKSGLEDFVFQSIRSQLDQAAYLRGLCEKLIGAKLHAAAIPLGQPPVLKALFQDELEQVAGLAAASGITDPNMIGRHRMDRLAALAADDREVVSRVLHATEAAGRFILIPPYSPKS